MSCPVTWLGSMRNLIMIVQSYKHCDLHAVTHPHTHLHTLTHTRQIIYIEITLNKKKSSLNKWILYLNFTVIVAQNQSIICGYIYIYKWHVNVRVLGKGFELLSANGGRFEINQLLFADYTALVADSEEKLLCEFGRVWERRKLRVNVGKSKVMRCSRFGNGDRMYVILNGEPLEEVDCF